MHPGVAHRRACVLHAWHLVRMRGIASALTKEQRQRQGSGNGPAHAKEVNRRARQSERASSSLLHELASQLSTFTRTSCSNISSRISCRLLCLPAAAKKKMVVQQQLEHAVELPTYGRVLTHILVDLDDCL